jgi:hypothetical protein
LRGNKLISTLAAVVFVPSVFGENIPTAEFGLISAETACWDIEREKPNFQQGLLLAALSSSY